MPSNTHVRCTYEHDADQKLSWRLILETRSSWLNCALRDDEAVYWVSIGRYEAIAVGNC